MEPMSDNPTAFTDEGAEQEQQNDFSMGNSELRRRNVNEATKNETTSKSPQATKTVEEEEPPTSYSGNTGGGFYECNICFDTAVYPVLTVCGHLFCWSCLAQWLHAQSRNPTCPVCKAGCGKDKVIPVYGRGKEEKDPREDPSIPTRPAGQRPPSQRDNNRFHPLFGQSMRGTTYAGGNVSITAGFGIFPSFGVSFNIPTNASGQNSSQNAFFSRLILMILTLMIIAIMFY